MWRAIVIFLAVLWTVSAFAGVWLGQALSESAPFRPDSLLDPGRSNVGLVVQGGIPAAPQPRMDGSLGVPERGVGGLVAEVSLVSALENTASSVSMSTVTVDPAAVRDPARDPARILAGLDGGQQGEMEMVVPGLNALEGQWPGTPMAPAQAPPPAPTGPDWLQQLRTGIAACAAQQRYSQPECEQRLRQQLCTPNDGWGVVGECPGFLRNLRL